MRLAAVVVLGVCLLAVLASGQSCSTNSDCGWDEFCPLTTSVCTSCPSYSSCTAYDADLPSKRRCTLRCLGFYFTCSSSSCPGSNYCDRYGESPSEQMNVCVDCPNSNKKESCDSSSSPTNCKDKCIDDGCDSTCVALVLIFVFIIPITCCVCCCVCCSIAAQRRGQQPQGSGNMELGASSSVPPQAVSAAVAYTAPAAAVAPVSVKEQPPTPVSSWIETLRKESSDFSRESMVVRDAPKYSGITTDEVRQILELFSMSSTQRTALKALYPQMQDQSGIHAVISNMSSFEQDIVKHDLGI